MCNNIHEIYKKIPEQGHGWKIFGPKGNPCFSGQEYTNRRDGFIRWNKRESSGDGFCFFLTRKEARRALNELKSRLYVIMENPYLRHLIKKIEYRKGLCKQQEPNMAEGVYEIALCKEFRVVD